VNVQLKAGAAIKRRLPNQLCASIAWCPFLFSLEIRLGSCSLSGKGCSGRDGHWRGEEGEFMFTFREKLLRWGLTLERGGRDGGGHKETLIGQVMRFFLVGSVW
jgi:hypothetical protein